MASSRQLAAIMFTDIVGYTSLMGEDEGKAFAVLSQNRLLQRPLIEQYHGRWIKELGDGVLAAFFTVTDAVLCAVAIQRACSENEDFKLRIGIHQGEVVFEDGDVFGDGVNIASRLQAGAPVGGIWISEVVYNNIYNKKEIRSRFVQEEVLKNVKEPVRVYEIITNHKVAILSSPVLPQRQPLSGRRAYSRYKKIPRPLIISSILLLLLVLTGLGYWWYKSQSTQPIRSIAVLPFVNESGTPEMEYLSDGMTEMLINSLSQLPQLNVKARSSVFPYKGTQTDEKTIGSELNVQAVLRGRVVQQGDNLTLYLALVDATNNNQLWGEQYHRKARDLLGLQKDITGDVSEKLRIRLSGAEEQKLAKNYTANAEAYQLYLKGRYHWSKLKQGDIDKAIHYFQQAIALDSNYALAYTGLVEAYEVYPSGRLPPERLAKLREAARKAVSLDEHLADAHKALGFVLYRFDYDFPAAEREFRRAITLNPNDASAHQRYGELLFKLARWEEAFTEYQRALEIEPVSLVINASFGLALFYAKRYDEAIVQLKKVLELDSSFSLTHSALSFAYQLKGRYAESVEERARFFELFGDEQGARLVRETFAKGGWQGYLRAMTSEQRPMNQSQYFTATFYAALGEKEKAFAALNQAYERQEVVLTNLKVDPRLDPLRADPRFQELLQRIGLK